MATKKVPVNTFVIRLFCDECGEVMKYVGILPNTNPVLYRHICGNGHQKIEPSVYPLLEYTFVNDEPDKIDVTPPPNRVVDHG